MTAVVQRPLRGSRISTFYPIKNLPSLASLDSAFQLQEYISLLIRLDVHDVEAITSLPGTSSLDPGKEREEHDRAHADETSKEGIAVEKPKTEVTVDEACWIYEQLRRLAQDLSHPLITTLQQECTRASCPEMKAGEWLYLCVAHGNDGAMEQCCAIDYILHTVDSATALLNSPRTFPSRLQIPGTSHRHFSSLARRLGRIFAHAYFHHREAFEQAEAESSLYARFLALTSKFDLVPSEFLVIPTSGMDGQYEPKYQESGRGPGFGQAYPPPLQSHMSQQLQQHLQQQQRGDDHEYSRDLRQRGQKLQHPLAQVLHQPSLQPHNRSPVPPSMTSSSIGDSPGPSPLSRSRFGRNRTDTMVFTDAEASAVADELRNRGGGGSIFDAEVEKEKPKEIETPSVVGLDEDTSPELENDVAEFEISLSPDEEIESEFGVVEEPAIEAVQKVVVVELEQNETEPVVEAEVVPLETTTTTEEPIPQVDVEAKEETPQLTAVAAVEEEPKEDEAPREEEKSGPAVVVIPEYKRDPSPRPPSGTPPPPKTPPPPPEQIEENKPEEGGIITMPPQEITEIQIEESTPVPVPEVEVEETPPAEEVEELQEDVEVDSVVETPSSVPAEPADKEEVTSTPAVDPFVLPPSTPGAPSSEAVDEDGLGVLSVAVSDVADVVDTGAEEATEVTTTEEGQAAEGTENEKEEETGDEVEAAAA